MVEGVNKVPGPPYMNDASNQPEASVLCQKHTLLDSPSRLAK